ncbi:hypothetical protein HPT25_07170 [Bacillus sp. BRMEA1]|uniref:hypothetical protein n=1 Tax=Neobacillus endophyticus TaxID=2738405 RepID=UPI001566AC6C|nr:hypothetical protein [Neobacillus endophyticus]NRD77277.1 hypothetical protein [Neobacillus endophyticus]
MSKAATSEIKRGQALSFRIPSDTPEHLVKQLQKLKEAERRNFSSKLAEFVLQGVSSSYSREKETVTIPLPRTLSKAQRDWLKHEHSEALLGSIVYQLISDPLRATALLASLNSNSVDIDEALYLQEKVFPEQLSEMAAAASEEIPFQEEAAFTVEIDDDDLSEFAWEPGVEEPAAAKESDEEDWDADELLGGFLASMNK